VIKWNNRWTIYFGVTAGLGLAMQAQAAPVAPAAQASARLESVAAVPEAPAKAAVPDFSGVWEMAKLELVLLPEVAGAATLTPEAKAARDQFEQKFDKAIDDPAKVCLIKGMPWTMLTRARNYPVEIYQNADRLFMTFELYDQFRSIRINGEGMPAGYPPSPSGWSVAHWEGQTLVIETTGLTELNMTGTMQRSEDAKVTERWNFRDNAEFGRVIDVEMSVEDPAVFTAPAKARQILKKSPEGVRPGGYNCSSALWDEHIERRKAELGLDR
jgi:hypothetical protein